MKSQKMRLSQNDFDYTSIRDIPEIRIRVQLLYQRLKELRVPPSAKFLEVGLGSGDLTCMLAGFARNVVCIDSEERRLREVSNYLIEFPDVNDVQFICGPAESVVLEDCAFDHIILFGLLEHCPDAVKVLVNLKRGLAEDGLLHILVNNAGSIHRWLGVEMGIIKDVTELSDSDFKLGHYRIYTRDILFDEISAAGLQVTHDDLHYLKPLPTSMLNDIPMEVHDALVRLGRRFPEFASYIYLEARKLLPNSDSL